MGMSGRRLAIIVDLDETLCCQLDVPVEAGVGVLRRIDGARLEVRYVTSRTNISRDITERFLRNNCLPGVQNVHYCPVDTTSLEHKRAQHQSLSLGLDVIASIGDSYEEEEAARSAGVLFIIVDPCNPAPAWAEIADRISEFRGFES